MPRKDQYEVTFVLEMRAVPHRGPLDPLSFGHCVPAYERREIAVRTEAESAKVATARVAAAITQVLQEQIEHVQKARL